MIGSVISRQLTISRSDRIPWTILLRSDHDPGDPARYVDRCWIRNFITTIGHFISHITIVKIHKLPGNIYWNMVCLVSTVCTFSMTLIKNTYLSIMECLESRYGVEGCISPKHDSLKINHFSHSPKSDVIDDAIVIRAVACGLKFAIETNWTCCSNLQLSNMAIRYSLRLWKNRK